MKVKIQQENDYYAVYIVYGGSVDFLQGRYKTLEEAEKELNETVKTYRSIINAPPPKLIKEVTI